MSDQTDDTPALQSMLDEYDAIVALRYRDIPKGPLWGRVRAWARKWRYRARRARMLTCRECNGHGLQRGYAKTGELIYVEGRPCQRCNGR